MGKNERQHGYFDAKVDATQEVCPDKFASDSTRVRDTFGNTVGFAKHLADQSLVSNPTFLPFRARSRGRGHPEGRSRARR
jgi:hypothetical protein